MDGKLRNVRRDALIENGVKSTSHNTYVIEYLHHQSLQQQLYLRFVDNVPHIQIKSYRSVKDENCFKELIKNDSPVNQKKKHLDYI